MILHAVLHAGSQPQRPCLVWLHGFSGSHQEWMPVSTAFNEWSQLWLDLPGHGASVDLQGNDFETTDSLIAATLAHYHIDDYWLVGYSLGGRLAMYHATQGRAAGLCGLVVEGGHPGLDNETDREARRLHDAHWAARFCHEPLSQVLEDWYQQPVFSDLDEQRRTALVALRSQNNPAALALMLEATSLSRQPDLQATLSKLQIPFYYLCGERDMKFRAIAARLGLTPEIISGAGHNAHLEAPAAFSARLLNLLHDSDF
ncbi:2-succinyl-6-hydroxy-2,4-cyclohexadiene-1-carboxylate synthase [Klebsiella sp. BIGb0407]|uniref:2-succinyl-6-hydroxy-2, 4-cyclohexadiene-1-carboxylate synthase n=1 Tax=Klebsiella sp. BIGb0407 TaxID=2940603 RepID=UPI002168DFB4|nr:2-succinyl-6-hydroxy-2,4-cyclohexadiene-1-carboxylate synthase [Klebsiella sp. BIGb0407]MCS3431651.1 2-succinyl-6-hydroxy-2,4-cyclohexadiene-1-carboxylate synthase [Klebsiella sp. BIGb0407]